MAYDDSHVNQIAGQTKENASTRMPTQRLIYYANGRFWAFFVYYEGSVNPRYRAFTSSPDGVNWDPITIMRGSRGGAEFSIAVDNEDNLHYVYAYTMTSGGELPKYRKGHLNADGTITWAAEEQEVDPEAELATDPTICVDSNGYPYITWILASCPEMTYGEVCSMPSYYGAFITKSSTNDGTWVTAAGFPFELADFENHLPIVVPLTNGKVYVVYAPSNMEGIILGRLWNGINWEEEEQVSTTRISGFYYGNHGVTSVNDDVHVVFLDEHYDIRYTKRTWGVGWGAETVLATGLHESVTPVICGRDHQGETGTICFWLDGEGIQDGYGYYKIYDDITGWEDTVEWFYDPEMLHYPPPDMFGYAKLNCAFKENAGIIPIIYRHGLSGVDWYKIYFNYLNKIGLACEDYLNQPECEAAGCYWYDNSCHSEPPPVECEDYLNQAECEAANCYWYNNSCHTNFPTCEELNNQYDCEAYGCYWYDNSCHSEPLPLECEEYLNQPACEAANCYWYNNSCHDNLPTCEELNNQTDCLAYACYWYDNSCHSEPPLVCEDYLTQPECEATNCYWYNDSCHSLLPSCELLDNQIDCEAYGCYWYDNSCHSEPPPLECEDYLTPPECIAANCYWWNGSCHSSLPTCEELNNQYDCLAYGCYWYDNSCHSEPPPLECEEYLNQPECEAANCYWYEGGCHSEAPPGEIDWLWVAVPLAVAAGMGIAVILLKKR